MTNRDPDRPSTPMTAKAVERSTLLQRTVEAFVSKYGSLRAASVALNVDHAYLSRLIAGEKDNPSDELLAALGLTRRIVIFRKPRR